MSHPLSSQVRAGLYQRISRDDDTATHEGVDRQESTNRATAERLGWTVAGVYTDNDVSATKAKVRADYQRLLADLRAGKLDAVIVFTQDRLTRKPLEWYTFADLGKRFATSAGELDLEDPDTDASGGFAAVGGRRESKLAAKRVKEAAAQRATKGRAHGRAPFGWRREVAISRGRVVDSWDVLEPAEAAFIQHAAAELLRGISLRTIAAEANAGAVKPRPYVFTKGRHAGITAVQTWSTSQLKALLLRASNAGLRTHRGEALDGVVAEWPPILDMPTYNRLLLVLKDPSRRTNDAGSTPRYLLSGTMANCSVCPDGGRINVVTGGSRASRRSAYVCVGKPGAKGCYQRHWIEDMDAYIGELVEARLADPVLAKVSPEVQLEIDALYEQIDGARAEQAEAGALVAAKAITLGQLVAINAGITTTVAELEERISALRPQLGITVELPDGWDGADLFTKRATIRQVFDRIELVPSAYSGKVRTADTIDEEVRVVFRGAVT